MRTFVLNLLGFYLLLSAIIFESKQDVDEDNNDTKESSSESTKVKELNKVMKRRLVRNRDKYFDAELALRWSKELGKNGKWNDIDYTTGCGSNRAEWHATDHLRRTVTISSVWVANKNSTLLTSATRALDHWLSNDFLSEDCVNAGGRSNLGCPCSTPGYWNTNWWYQMILLPDLIGSICLFLLPNLSNAQIVNCTRIMSRSWARIDGDPNKAMGKMTGANLLDVASVGGALALLTGNHSLYEKPVKRSMSECNFSKSTEGIKVDGSFMQHDAQLHTGSYGTVFIKQMLSLFVDTRGTTFDPPPDSVQDAFRTLISGAEWLVFQKKETKELAWSHSVIGRWVAQKWKDYNAIIGFMDLDMIIEATEGWDEPDVFKNIVNRLVDFENPYRLVGTRYFYKGDFLVHKGLGYMVTLKMFSSRTVNSECLNSQNPYGYHLSDGTIYTHRSGMEYNDIFGAWDWNLIPGTTTLYNETILACSTMNPVKKGRHQRVGATTLSFDNGGAAVAIMTHTDPLTKTHSWTKTFFFFPGAYAVQFPQLWWNNSSKNPMRTSLEQRLANGPVYVNGKLLQYDNDVQEQEKASTVWHDKIGYSLSHPVNLGVGVVRRFANWEKIGISTTDRLINAETQSHFLAYINHKRDIDESNLSYIVRLNLENAEFQNSPKGGVSILQHSENVTAAIFRDNNEIILGLAFISPCNYTTEIIEIPWISLNIPVLILLRRDNNQTWRLGLADSTQLLSTPVQIVMYLEGKGLIKKLIKLPTAPYAGSTVTVQL